MFTRQAPQINESLWQGGLSPAQAHAITNLLGQCRATLEHRGPIIIDYTSPNMRLVTPEIAKFEFPDIQLQPPEAIPPRPDGLPPIEELPPWEPDPFPPPPGPEYPGTGNRPGIPTDQPDGGGGNAECYCEDGKDGKDGDTVEEGDYIKITDKGNNKKEIALDHDDAGGIHCIFDYENEQVKGIQYKATNSAQDPCEGEEDEPVWKLSVNDNENDTTWDLASPDMQCIADYLKDLWLGGGNNNNVQVVTGISFDGSSLSFQKKNVTVVSVNGEETDTPIDTTTC